MSGSTGGVKAQWHLDELPDEDPFESVMYSSGVALDLTAPEDDLSRQLQKLVDIEERLENRGISCDLKWLQGQDCRDCPVAVLDRDDPRGQLCRVGKDQYAVLARRQERRAERAAPLEELVAIADAASEMVPDEIVELVTQVGA